jgi:hypothetical protein
VHAVGEFLERRTEFQGADDGGAVRDVEDGLTKIRVQRVLFTDLNAATV